jgi:hypothetical protein
MAPRASAGAAPAAEPAAPAALPSTKGPLFELGDRSTLRISVPDASGLLSNQLQLRGTAEGTEPIAPPAPAAQPEPTDDKEPVK